MAVTSNSYASNDDGDGVYFQSSDKVIKSLGKINLYNMSNDIQNSSLVITHQRLSTSGHTIDYVHPFYNDDFVMVHNGIINQFKQDEGSDTFGFWILFNKEFAKSFKFSMNDTEDKMKQEREKIIAKIIKKLFKDDQGSYSIFIYDKKTSRSYYFKNKSTSIYCYRIDNIVYITTNYSNKTLINLLEIDKEVVTIDIEDYKIYRFENTDTHIKIACIDNLKNKKSEEKNTSIYSYKRNSSKCSNCNQHTYGTTYYVQNRIYCESCWEFFRNYSSIDRSIDYV